MSVLLELKWMLLPFLACLVLSINHVYLGIHVIARRVIFVDLALAQIAALGATFALTLGYDPATDSLRISLFSLAFTFVGAGAFAVARMRREKVPQEAFIGIIYAAASAAAILILSKSATGGEELKHMLVGDVLLVTLPEIRDMALLYGAIGLFHVIFRRKFLAISIRPADAIAAHLNVGLLGHPVLHVVRGGDHQIRGDRRRIAGVFLSGGSGRARADVGRKHTGPSPARMAGGDCRQHPGNRLVILRRLSDRTGDRRDARHPADIVRHHLLRHERTGENESHRECRCHCRVRRCFCRGPGLFQENGAGGGDPGPRRVRWITCSTICKATTKPINSAAWNTLEIFAIPGLCRL